MLENYWKFAKSFGNKGLVSSPSEHDLKAKEYKDNFKIEQTFPVPFLDDQLETE
jgi:hypothetical protein